MVREATDGWVLSGSVILQSGTPFTAYTSASFQPTQDANGNVSGYKPGSGDYNGDGKNYDFPNAPATGYIQQHDRQSYLKGLFAASAFLCRRSERKEMSCAIAFADRVMPTPISACLRALASASTRSCSSARTCSTCSTGLI